MSIMHLRLCVTTVMNTTMVSGDDNDDDDRCVREAGLATMLDAYNEMRTLLDGAMVPFSHRTELEAMTAECEHILHAYIDAKQHVLDDRRRCQQKQAIGVVADCVRGVLAQNVDHCVLVVEPPPASVGIDRSTGLPPMRKPRTDAERTQARVELLRRSVASTRVLHRHEPADTDDCPICLLPLVDITDERRVCTELARIEIVDKKHDRCAMARERGACHLACMAETLASAWRHGTPRCPICRIEFDEQHVERTVVTRY